MRERRHHRFEAELMRHAAKFVFNQGFTCLVSVTRVLLNEEASQATVYLSVLPKEEQKKVLVELRKNTIEFKRELAGNMQTKFIPEVHFEYDLGEENRRRIDELLAS